MAIYIPNADPRVIDAAKALFQRWKDPSARSIIQPAPGSYALDEWENLPPSVTHEFYRDAEAAISAYQTVSG